jgi:hypothetical protein
MDRTKEDNLKVSKEAVIAGRADNKMARRIRTKGQTTKKGVELMCCENK